MRGTEREKKWTSIEGGMRHSATYAHPSIVLLSLSQNNPVEEQRNAQRHDAGSAKARMNGRQTNKQL
jgi:hypothetical protein